MKIEPPFQSICTIEENEENFILIFESDKIPYFNGKPPRRAKIRIIFDESEGSFKDG